MVEHSAFVNDEEKYVQRPASAVIPSLASGALASTPWDQALFAFPSGQAALSIHHVALV